MQTVSSNYETASKNTVRVPSQSVLVDWDNDHSFDDESENVIAIVVEKYIQEYLSSIYSAQADINLINSGEYTPIGEIPSILHTGDNDDYLNKASSQRKLAISSEGYYLSVMEDSGDTSVFFRISKDGGITWSEAVTLSSDGTEPSCVIDGDDNVYVTYLKADRTKINFIKLTYVSGAWSVGSVKEAKGATAGEAYYTPIVKIAESDKIFVVYMCLSSGGSVNNLYSTYTEDDGDTWDARDDIDGDTDRPYFTATVFGDTLYVFWANDDLNKIQYSYYSNFGSSTDLATSVDEDTPVSCASSDTEMAVLFMKNSKLYLNIYTTSWSGEIIVASDSDGYDYYNMTISDGFAYVVFYVTDSKIIRYTKINLSTKALSGKVEVYQGEIKEIACLELSGTSIVPFLTLDISDTTVYFSGLISNAQYNFRPGIDAKISFGFGEEDKLQIFRGLSEAPKANIKDGKIGVHFYDQIKKLQDFTLPQGSLYSNIRTDDYINKVLKEYFGEDSYIVINPCDSLSYNGNWVGIGDGVNLSVDTDDMMEGSGSILFDIDADYKAGNAAGIGCVFTSPMDFSVYNRNCKFRTWVYIPDITYITGLSLDMTDTSVDSNTMVLVAEKDFKGDDFTNGWNLVEFDFSDPFYVDSGFDDSDIYFIGISVTYSVDQDDLSGFRFDDFIMYTKDVPAYYHDKGLNTLNLAWFEGNKAAYEIKTACDAEGGRFYQHEQGYFVFENRQHYVVNEEHKSIVHNIDFNNAIDFGYMNDFSNIINQVELEVEPRVIQTKQVIWNYGEVPLAFTAGETKTIWASLEDPCGLISDPVATTDYTANAQSDGGGADKTAQIGISITKFAQASKLEITNNDAGTVYLTFLQLQGTPYQKQGKILVIAENKVSQQKYGLKKNSYDIRTNKYFQNSEDMQVLADLIIEMYSRPSGIISLESRCVPQLQIGDLVSVKNDNTGTYLIQRIIGIKISYNDNGFNSNIITRRVLQTEMQDYFTIGVSSIGGSHVIAP